MPVLIGLGMLAGAATVFAAFVVVGIWLARSEWAIWCVLGLLIVCGASCAGYGVTNKPVPVWAFGGFLLACLLMLASILCSEEW